MTNMLTLEDTTSLWRDTQSSGYMQDLHTNSIMHVWQLTASKQQNSFWTQVRRRNSGEIRMQIKLNWTALSRNIIARI